MVLVGPPCHDGERVLLSSLWRGSVPPNPFWSRKVLPGWRWHSP